MLFLYLKSMASHEKRPAIRLSTIVRKKYIAVQLLGKGGYGIVYEVMQLTSPATRFACKTELATLRNNLKSEWDVMTVMSERKSKHFIIAHEMGQERNYNYIIMNVVGPTLADLRKSITTTKKFTLYTTTVVSIQCFDALRELHTAGYIHRDVKPSNFAIGMPGSEKEKLVYILDFGICRKIYKSGQLLRKPRAKVPFRGTTQYCSPNVHLRLEPGRHDDFWSMLYMMIEFHLGDLPWEKQTKEEIKKSKDARTDELLEQCPPEFRFIKRHIRQLAYNTVPDYEKLRQVLCQLFRANSFAADRPLDWQPGGEHAAFFKTMWRRKSGGAAGGAGGKESLEEILNIPKDFPKFTDADFPEQEEEPQHNESTSQSDDTIIDKSVIIKNVPAAAPRDTNNNKRADVNSPERAKTKVTTTTKTNVKPAILRKNMRKKR